MDKENSSKPYKKLYILVIGFFSLLLIAGSIAYFLPNLARIFVSLSDEDKKKVAEIDKRICDEGGKFDEKKNELGRLQRDNAKEKDKLQISSLQFLRSKITLYNLINKRFPTEKEVIKVIGRIPVEPASGSAKIHFSTNNLGGWVYNQKTGEVGVNN